MTQTRTDAKAGDSNVISMRQHQSRMDQSPLAELRSYWDGLRCGRLLPLRSEIDPREIAGALEYGFILEHLQPGAVRFRLAGMHLSDLMGMEVRGMPMRAFISPTSRPRFSAMLERVFKKPEIHEHIMVSEDSAGTVLKARMLILPLRSENGAINRAIGCLTTDGVVGLAPRRFRVLETRITNLTNGAETREMGNVPVPYTPAQTEQVPQQAAGFREPQAAFEVPDAGDKPASAKPAKAPFLRIVSNNDA